MFKSQRADLSATYVIDVVYLRFRGHLAANMVTVTVSFGHTILAVLAHVVPQGARCILMNSACVVVSIARRWLAVICPNQTKTNA